MSTPPLASGPEGPDALRPLLDTVLHALAEGTAARGGPLPAGGPAHVAERLRTALGDPLPHHGSPDALHTLVRALAEGAADPADPLCAAHLHCPPLAVATAADLAASALNPSLDSWDQAPAASELEALLTRALADLVYGNPDDTSHTSHTSGAEGTEGTKGTKGTEIAEIAEIAEGTRGAQGARGTQGDALVTTGGTESNQLALLLAREKHHGVQLVCGANAHHSLHRATWLLGLPEPVVLPAPAGTLDPAALDSALSDLRGPLLVAATAGTTDAGLIDPLPEIADLCATHGARLHIDAAYGGGLLFSDRHRTKLDGLAHADTVTLDLHKLGWQPVAAGLLAVRDPTDLTPLTHRADYLNADDDTEAGHPDLLGRSLRTTRRPDILKIAVTLKTLGRHGIGHLVDQVCAHAHELADLTAAHPGFELYDHPVISTVLFRPRGATDDTVAAVRRTLLDQGRAVLGRATLDGRRWLKATLLNPHTRPGDLATLLKLVEGHTPR
ncbi:pyridoxal phosphate-dependent decarboxylase family protein [Streptomyces sp. NBC_00328]|uniref:pyridoxal phosphate-dependent decarboxylase family protein n=1 Tax=Streptomyces sp. NBC_00328 TaxID=2903646 RepID=UPI002E2B01CE|nr:aminotransferase class V-fold PLP-dependent enzyme [Streptomyces sp. NBC_00328]